MIWLNTRYTNYGYLWHHLLGGWTKLLHDYEVHSQWSVVVSFSYVRKLSPRMLTISRCMECGHLVTGKKVRQNIFSTDSQAVKRSKSEIREPTWRWRASGTWLVLFHGIINIKIRLKGLEEKFLRGMKKWHGWLLPNKVDRGGKTHLSWTVIGICILQHRLGYKYKNKRNKTLLQFSFFWKWKLPFLSTNKNIFLTS